MPVRDGQGGVVCGPTTTCAAYLDYIVRKPCTSSESCGLPNFAPDSECRVVEPGALVCSRHCSDVNSFVESLPTDKRPKDTETLAKELVQARKLTRYQAQAVYQGKIKGLVC